jgi:hypothetical protein
MTGSFTIHDIANTTNNVDWVPGTPSVMTFRARGVVLFLTISYSNDAIHPEDFAYVYRVAMVPGAEYKTEEPLYDYVNTNTTVDSINILDRHGIHIVFVQTGKAPCLTSMRSKT